MAEDRSSVDVIRESKLLAYTFGAVLVIAGAVVLWSSAEDRFFIARVIGAMLIVVGLADLIEAIRFHRGMHLWGLLVLRGVVNVGFGAALLFWSQPTINVLFWLIGLDFVLAGILGLVVRGQLPAEQRAGTLGRSLVTIFLGIAIMVWPDVTKNVVALIVGIGLILTGLMFAWSGHAISKLAKEADANLV